MKGKEFIATFGRKLSDSPGTKEYLYLCIEQWNQNYSYRMNRCVITTHPGQLENCISFVCLYVLAQPG